MANVRKIDLKDCRVFIRDGSTTPNEIEVTIGDGNVSWTEGRNVEYELNRGKISGQTVRKGDEMHAEVSFDFVYDYIVGSGVTGASPTVHEALTQSGLASTWVSSDTDDACAPYAVDIVVEHKPNCTGADMETLTFPDFRYESINPNIGDGNVSVSGKISAEAPTATRGAQSTA